LNVLVLARFSIGTTWCAERRNPLQIAFGSADLETAELLSRLCEPKTDPT
jgi:hypothetical protein